MQPRVKYGLIVGIVGMILNICVAAALGVCGPLMALVAGAAAGFLAAREERAADTADGARLGAISGAIAGGLVFVGQLIGGLGVLALIRFAGLNFPSGAVPGQWADAPQQLAYLIGGLGMSICFGLAGVALAALAGAGTGYLGTPTPIAAEAASANSVLGDKA